MAISFPNREWLSLYLSFHSLPSYLSSSGRFFIQLLSCKKVLLLFASRKPNCLWGVLFISINRKNEKLGDVIAWSWVWVCQPRNLKRHNWLPSINRLGWKIQDCFKVGCTSEKEQLPHLIIKDNMLNCSGANWNCPRSSWGPVWHPGMETRGPGINQARCSGRPLQKEICLRSTHRTVLKVCSKY